MASTNFKFITFVLLLFQIVLSSDSCTTDSECSPYFTCQGLECKHKKVWPPTLLESFGILSILLVTIVSSAGGIGGGGVIVPLCIIILKFGTKEAIAISNGLILAIGTTKSIISMFRNHPTIKNRTIIDYNIILIFMPTMILGAFLGSLVGQMAPNIFQLLLLSVVLFFTIVKSIWSGVSRCKKENKALAQQAKIVPADPKKEETDKEGTEIIETKIEPSNYNEPEKEKQTKVEDHPKEVQETQKNLMTELTSQKEQQLPALEEEETNSDPKKFALLKKLQNIANSNFYWKKIGVIILIELSVVIVLVLRGGRGINSIIGAEKCTFLDGIIFLAYALLSLLLFILSLLVVFQEGKDRSRCDWPDNKDEVKLEKSLFVSGAIISFFVGLLSVIIGVGGSLLITPILISFNVLPEVIAYTGMYLTTLSALISTTLFIISGVMPLDFLALIGVLVILGVLFADWQVSKLVKKLGRQSLIIFFFIFVNLFAWGLVTYSAWDAYDGLKGIVNFQNYCDIE